MPHSISDLLDLLELERLEVNLYRGRQPDTTMQRVFGGQVAAQALRAACHTVDPELSVHSMHSYFLRPGDTSVPIIYDVERIRNGRSFSTRRTVARQHGKAIYYLTASFQVSELGFDHQDVLPDVPAPDDCPTVAEVVRTITGRSDDAWEREWAALDVRFAGDSRPGGALAGPGEPARTRVWVRTSGEVPPDPVVNTCLLAYISDLTLLGVSLVPHGLLLTSARQVQPASLDHSMWFHRRFRADGWLLYDQHSPSASGARGLALGRVFTESGLLVSTVAQEGLIRPIGEAREHLVEEEAGQDESG